MKSGSMRAVGVVQARREVAMFGQAKLCLTAPTEVRIRTIEVGICGTDREICSFAYGTPPDGSEYLVLGHEALGEVLEVGAGLGTATTGGFGVPPRRRPRPVSARLSLPRGA